MRSRQEPGTANKSPTTLLVGKSLLPEIATPLLVAN